MLKPLTGAEAIARRPYRDTNGAPTALTVDDVPTLSGDAVTDVVLRTHIDNVKGLALSTSVRLDPMELRRLIDHLTALYAEMDI